MLNSETTVYVNIWRMQRILTKPEQTQNARFEVFVAVKIRVLLYCDTVQCCGRIPPFQRSMLPPSSPWR